MSDLFFYTITIAFAVGIFLRSFFQFGIFELLFVLLVSLVAALMWKRSGASYRTPLFLFSLFLFAGVLGALRLEITQWHSSTFLSYDGEEVLIEGVIAREPDVRARQVQLYVEEVNTKEIILVSTDRFNEFVYGDLVTVEGKITKPELFETDLGRVFNYPSFLRARGVSVTIPFADVQVTGSGEGNSIIAALLTFKHAFMRSLESLVPEPHAGLGEGLLLGVKRALGEDLETVFRTTGIIHIVVLSGYNVMIVSEAIMRLLAFFFGLRTRLVIGIVAIGSFALMVGLSATVVRASLMAVMVLIARATGRTYAITRALMLAGIGMLLFNPYLLAFDPSFQLSFLATLGLLLLAPKIEEWFQLIPTTLQVREFVVATIATQIMVLPLLLYLIGEFSVVAVMVNVLVLPMVPVAMGFTFLTGVIGFFTHSIASLFGYAGFFSLAYIITVAELFARLPFASFHVPQFPFWMSVAAYGCIAYALSRTARHEDEFEAFSEIESNGLEGWIIEDEPEGELRSPSGSSETLPFR